VTELHLLWSGPYSWPDFEAINGLPALPAFPGVYLNGADYKSGYLICSAGITGRPFHKRFREHTKCFLNGDYTVLEVPALQQGRRCEVWHGWGYARAHRAEFVARQREIRDAAKRHMAAHRLFVAHVEERRIRERIEAAIMKCLYALPPPLCDVPDRGMMLAPGRPNEAAITVCNTCSGELWGLPEQLSI
jgi:hypothetical protein